MSRSMIVTGAGAGIGESIARFAADAGYRVGVLDINGEAATAVAESLPDAVALAAAVNDPDAVEAAFDAFGTPDALVNNAGIVRFGPLLNQTIDDFRAVIDINLTGAFVCSTACARRMADNGGGSIVSVTSINGIQPGPNTGAYAASKAGLNLLSKQMSIEWGALGIRVNTVVPTWMWGPPAESFIKAEAERRGISETLMIQEITANFCIPEIPKDDDVAEAVVFLASDRARLITGQNLMVNSGQLMT